MNAAQLDAVMQRKKAVDDGRDPDELCYHTDRTVPFCTKVKGHDGPHYCAAS